MALSMMMNLLFRTTFMHQKTLTFRTIRTHLELEESGSFAEFDFKNDVYEL